MQSGVGQAAVSRVLRRRSQSPGDASVHVHPRTHDKLIRSEGFRMAAPRSFKETAVVEDSSFLDNPGTILEALENVDRTMPERPRPDTPPPPPFPAVEEVLYRSPFRWKAPRILICDDDSLEQGETVRVRSDKVTIGRTKGDIVIGHDVAMSGTHAEVVRKAAGGRHAWVLRDLNSSNGTLARAAAVTLRPGTTILLGSKRYRCEQFSGAISLLDGDKEPATRMLQDVSGLSAAELPALIEVAVSPGVTPARYPFRSSRITIGRPGFGNDIEIDDLCLAGRHAVVTRDAGGGWQLKAEPSLNGVWVRVDRIQLVDNCLFQCGEQRFRFRR